MSRLVVFLDAETIPPDRDEPTLRHKLEGLPEEPYRKLALDGLYARILCLGLVIEQAGRVIHRGVLGRDRATRLFHLDEGRTLRAFWRLLDGFDSRRDLLVGFNLLDFDLPLLCQRSILLGVKPSFEICFARFRSAPVYDVMWQWECWRKKRSLDELARAFGISSPKDQGIDGSQVYDFYLAGRHEEIASYCLRDVEATRALYCRLRYLPPPEVVSTVEPATAPVAN